MEWVRRVILEWKGIESHRIISGVFVIEWNGIFVLEWKGIIEWNGTVNEIHEEQLSSNGIEWNNPLEWNNSKVMESNGLE